MRLRDVVSGRVPSQVPASGLVTLQTWGGYHRGDKIVVDGMKGSYVFIEHVTPASGDPWVTVYGGASSPGGLRRYRSVAPDRVRKK